MATPAAATVRALARLGKRGGRLRLPAIPRFQHNHQHSGGSSSKLFGAAAAPIGAALVGLGIHSQQQEQVKTRPQCRAALVSPNFSDSIALRYSIHGECLGGGNYGSVFKAVDQATGELVAVKRVPKSKSSEAAIQDETSILQATAHKNIIQLRAVGGDQSSWYIVMELARGVELYDRLVTRGMLSQAQSSALLKQLLDALVYLHRCGITHGDIKPENIIVNDDDDSNGGLTVKLADFGSAFRTRAGVPRRKDYTTTAAYSPPEVVSGAAAATEAADVFSLGVVAYILLTGRHPFDPSGDASEEDVLARIVSDEPDFSDAAWGDVDAAARDLVRRALSKAPSARPTASAMLAHPWVQQQRTAPSPAAAVAEAHAAAA
ncbi:kinase-like domain-containing protein [Tribonema minus]|uniref:Kinase-like domain-containing protein n=1 Tax=Tribonema minus TaxID=303371 RepID=A0A835ZES4_9STRA|nr:kinase-like domain-containing protein [Tribonema minus]